MSAASILLVRHAETPWSLAKRHTGRSDIALTEHGREAAARLQPLLSGYSSARVLTSPSRRARETCELSGLSDGALSDERLYEWDYGAYEGLTMHEIQERNPGWNLWRDGAPEGESTAAVQARAEALIAELDRQAQTTVLFAHGHILRVIGACWIGLGSAGGAHLALSTASLSELSHERSSRVIARWNLQAA